MKLTYKYLFVLLSIALFSCNHAASDAQESSHSPGIVESIAAAIKSIASPKKLSPEEYITWVKEQDGVTYHSVENDQFSLSLEFHPAQLEAYSAAAANGENPKNVLSKYLDLQKDFYYCTAGCIIKSESAANPIKKTDLLNVLKQQLSVVKNNKDTLSDIITESFPSYVMNQPNTLLILIPNTDSSSNYRITINGSSFHLKDCQLNLSGEDIQSFPLIKL